MRNRYPLPIRTGDISFSAAITNGSKQQYKDKQTTGTGISIVSAHWETGSISYHWEGSWRSASGGIGTHDIVCGDSTAQATLICPNIGHQLASMSYSKSKITASRTPDGDYGGGYLADSITVKATILYPDGTTNVLTKSGGGPITITPSDGTKTVTTKDWITI